jgi:hypothetical protein
VNEAVDRDFAGRCLCGEVRFTAHGAPDLVAICYCDACRRHTGSAFAIYADYQRERVKLDGAFTEFASSSGVLRGFCARCGSTISYRGANLAEMIHLHIGVFDRADLLVPTREECVGARLGWLAEPLIATKAPSHSPSIAPR